MVFTCVQPSLEQELHPYIIRMTFYFARTGFQRSRRSHREGKSTAMYANITDQYPCVVQAKDMVGLVNKFAAKLEEKKGSLTEDEVWGCWYGNQHFMVVLIVCADYSIQILSSKRGYCQPSDKVSSIVLSY